MSKIPHYLFMHSPAILLLSSFFIRHVFNQPLLADIFILSSGIMLIISIFFNNRRGRDC